MHDRPFHLAFGLETNSLILQRIAGPQRVPLNLMFAPFAFCEVRLRLEFRWDMFYDLIKTNDAHRCSANENKRVLEYCSLDPHCLLSFQQQLQLPLHHKQQVRYLMIHGHR